MMQEEIKEEFDNLELQITKTAEKSQLYYENISRDLQDHIIEDRYEHEEIYEKLIAVDTNYWKKENKKEKLSFMANQLKQLLAETGPLTSKQIQDSLRISPGRVSQLISELSNFIVFEDIKTGRRGRPKKNFKIKGDDKKI